MHYPASSHALQSALQRKNYYPWEPAQNLGPNVNTPYFEGQPSISANGKTLY
jgi:WD40-like Beta Propeller Repeat